MSIIPVIDEYQKYIQEMATLQTRLNVLRKHKSKCEALIFEYLVANSLPGIKYKDTTILVKQKRARLTKSKKIANMTDYFKSSGITANPEDLIKIIERPRNEYTSILRIKK